MDQERIALRDAGPGKQPADEQLRDEAWPFLDHDARVVRYWLGVGQLAAYKRAVDHALEAGLPPTAKVRIVDLLASKVIEITYQI